MNHPALRHVRNTLIAALGLSGCTERSASVPEAEPPDAALLDPDPVHCADGEPIRTADGRETGYIRCPDGSTDRVGPATCDPIVSDWHWRCEGQGAEDDACSADADCVEKPDGHCVGANGGCFCHYPCRADTDCADDEVCVCNSLGPEGAISSHCAPAPCRGVADCGGARCGVSVYAGGCGPRAGLACRTPRDTCHGHGNCPPDDWSGTGQCWPAGDSNGGRIRDEPTLLDTWHCDSPSWVCGRPLRVARRPRLAGPTDRADWRASTRATHAPNAELAAHWSAVAALEHASVASFARFSLQLLALGAPSDLVADCQRAAADEIEHARLAYGIASAFAGEAIGPGPLTLDDMTLETGPATVLREVIIEGCIGETLGAVEAAEAAHAIGDPAIATACARIAEDEPRHAALGWRTARWLLECHPELASMARDAFVDGIQHHTDGTPASGDNIMSHGIAVRPDARRAAVAEVIHPLAAQLAETNTDFM